MKEITNNSCCLFLSLNPYADAERRARHFIEESVSVFMNRKRLLQRHLVFLLLAMTMLLGGAILWVLNIEEVVRGPWSSILGVCFTVLGVVLALLQWHAQITSRNAVTDAGFLTPTHQSMKLHPSVEGIMLEGERQKGALLVYTNKKLRGATINLHRGFDAVHLHSDVATNVIPRRVNGHMVCVGIFPSLEPSNYTVYLNSRERVAKITVLPSHTAEVDWRY